MIIFPEITLKLQKQNKKKTHEHGTRSTERKVKKEKILHHFHNKKFTKKISEPSIIQKKFE